MKYRIKTEKLNDGTLRYYAQVIFPVEPWLVKFFIRGVWHNISEYGSTSANESSYPMITIGKAHDAIKTLQTRLDAEAAMRVASTTYTPV